MFIVCCIVCVLSRSSATACWRVSTTSYRCGGKRRSSAASPRCSVCRTAHARPGRSATTYCYRRSLDTRCRSILKSSLRVSDRGAGEREGECRRRGQGNVGGEGRGMWEEGVGECGRNATTYCYKPSVVTRCRLILKFSLRVSDWGRKGECGRRGRGRGRGNVGGGGRGMRRMLQPTTVDILYLQDVSRSQSLPSG